MSATNEHKTATHREHEFAELGRCTLQGVEHGERVGEGETQLAGELGRRRDGETEHPGSSDVKEENESKIKRLRRFHLVDGEERVQLVF